MVIKVALVSIGISQLYLNLIHIHIPNRNEICIPFVLVFLKKQYQFLGEILFSFLQCFFSKTENPIVQRMITSNAYKIDTRHFSSRLNDSVRLNCPYIIFLNKGFLSFSYW